LEVFSWSSLQSIVIPRNVRFIDGSAFIGVTLPSISIESGNQIFVIEKDFLIDVLHHKLIRNFSTSSAIEIGRNIEILGSKCFYNCKLLSSITFESNSHLTAIESEAFSLSSLQSIVIPRNVRFIDGSAFINVRLSSISIESENEIFVVENDFLIDILHHKLIRNFSKSSEIEIAETIEILGSHCFSTCESLSSITFESNSHLTRIESDAFSWSSLQSNMIPRNVEILGSSCFSYCRSLSSITFESNSHLTRIESEAFSTSSLQFILIPPTILFIASDAVDIASGIKLIDGDSCPEFDRWLELKRLSVTIECYD
jgi:uncharacterized protein YajQ (UPF0234 family)